MAATRRTRKPLTRTAVDEKTPLIVGLLIVSSTSTHSQPQQEPSQQQQQQQEDNKGLLWGHVIWPLEEHVFSRHMQN